MEIRGTIIELGQRREGVSASTGNAWAVQEYVLQDDKGNMVAFEVFGIEKLAELNIQKGDVVDAHIDISARQYNGRWYNTLWAWKVERVAAPKPQPQPASDNDPF